MQTFELENPPVAVTGLIGPVYHGTCSVFEEFSIRKATGGLFGPGFYFTDDPEIASSYALPRNQHWKSKKVRETSWKNLLRQARIKLNKEDYKYFLDSYKEIKNQGNLMVIFNDFFEDFKIDIAPFVDSNCESNVWIAYLDLRNPFDARKQFTNLFFTALYDLDEIFISREIAQEINLFLSDKAKRGMVFGKDLIYALEGLPNLNKELQVFFGIYRGKMKSSDSELAVTVFLQSLGYDGIIYQGGEVMGTTKHTAYVVWQPEQIIPAYQLTGD